MIGSLPEMLTIAQPVICIRGSAPLLPTPHTHCCRSHEICNSGFDGRTTTREAPNSSVAFVRSLRSRATYEANATSTTKRINNDQRGTGSLTPRNLTNVPAEVSPFSDSPFISAVMMIPPAVVPRYFNKPNPHFFQLFLSTFGIIRGYKRGAGGPLNQVIDKK